MGRSCSSDNTASASRLETLRFAMVLSLPVDILSRISEIKYTGTDITCQVATQEAVGYTGRGAGAAGYSAAGLSCLDGWRAYERDRCSRGERTGRLCPLGRVV